jgi:hypothetical protein
MGKKGPRRRRPPEQTREQAKSRVGFVSTDITEGDETTAQMPAATLRAAIAEQQAAQDGSIDVEFEMSSASLVASEVTNILESIGKRVDAASESDPDTHSAGIDFDPDATRRIRRR